KCLSKNYHSQHSSSIKKKTLNLFCAQQWISNEYFDIARVNLEQSATFSKRTDGLMGQYMITGYIYLVDT
uniref:Uncharacterized protein n=1 Tax=Romanomermis culicivorax TaxID=13658 RepID=A0A915ILD6_ROMCU